MIVNLNKALEWTVRISKYSLPGFVNLDRFCPNEYFVVKEAEINDP